ncbi:MFS transporter [Natranaeroarchaeum sulfidigenes]|uniref:MFS family permease n=1 Tax=Natranaeroarchaeum sulfidigenes TaxID=2784880 RepID=A0A897MS96_9EURY|nr:MFS transporter [Natranaeroarchaeum sulfidigenes]QSG03434.1 MFS family permease [Natranaeroarchaeum sulfidigenes]
MRWRYRETVLALVTLAFFVTMVGRLAISPVVPEITAEFEVSNAFVGAALTGMWLTYAFAQFPSGLLADRYGERPIILVSVGGTGLTAILVVTAPSFGVFFLGTVSLGVMAGLHYSVATTLLSRTYDDNLGTAVGIHNSGAPIAGLVTPVVVSWAAIRYGWRPAVAITALVAIPATLLFARYVHPTEPQRPDQRVRDRLEPGAMVELLSRPKIAFTAVIALVADFTWQGLASFLPTFFAAHRGHSATLAGVAFAAYFVVQGILQVWVGSLADRYGRDRAIALCFGTSILGLAFLVGVPGPAGLVAGILLLGLGMGWGAAVFPRFMDNLSADEQGAGFGLVRTVYMIVASSGSVVVGLLADLYGWAVSFGALIGLLGLVLVLVLVNLRFDLGY